MIDIKVASECYGDTLLIETLLERKVNHVKGNGNLRLYFERHRLQDSIIIGVTDYDKDAPAVFEKLNFKEVPTLSSAHLKVFKREGRNHLLIYLCPALENFLMQCCEEIQGFQPPVFVRDLIEFKKKIKRLNVNKDTEVVSLIKNLVKSNPHTLSLLKKIIAKFLKTA